MKKTIPLLLSLSLLASLLSGCGGSASSAASSHILGTTVITQVYGDGQKVAEVAVKYDKTIDPASVSAGDYSVDGLTVESAYTSGSAAIVSGSSEGQYVILNLSTDYILSNYAASMSGNPGGSQDSSSRPSGSPDASASPAADASASPAVSGAPSGGMGGSDSEKSNQLTVTLAQTGDVSTSAGAVYSGSAATWTTDPDGNDNLVVKDFQQLVYTASDGSTLMYNLYLPADYKTTAYPVVLFMPDATATSTDPVKTLTQGLGAVVWAESENQKDEPCIVLAPQYTGDTSGSATDTDKANTLAVLQEVVSKYNADANRLYVTGQSAGCIRAISMMIDDPTLFAGAFLVAGQASDEYADKLAALAGEHIWMLCSGGDERAYPGMTAIETAVKGAGTQVTDSAWSAKLSEDEQNAQAEAAEKAGTSINFTVLDAGSMIPDGVEDSAVTEHLNTWRVAYSISAIRSWLFEQSKA